MALVYGLKIVQEVAQGLSNGMDRKGFEGARDIGCKGAFHGVRLAPPEPELDQHKDDYPVQLYPVAALPCCPPRHLAPGYYRQQRWQTPPGSEKRQVWGLQPVRNCLPGGQRHHVGQLVAGKLDESTDKKSAITPRRVDQPYSQPDARKRLNSPPQRSGKAQTSKPLAK